MERLVVSMALTAIAFVVIGAGAHVTGVDFNGLLAGSALAIAIWTYVDTI
jgi:hypothetical protein